MGRQIDEFVQEQLFPTMTPPGIRNLHKLMDILEKSGGKGMRRLELLLADKPLPNAWGAAENPRAIGRGNVANMIKRFETGRIKREIPNGNDQETGRICDTETTGNPMVLDSNEHYSHNVVKTVFNEEVKEQKKLDQAKVNGKN
jgi:hypothetical protein